MSKNPLIADQLNVGAATQVAATQVNLMDTNRLVEKMAKQVDTMMTQLSKMEARLASIEKQAIANGDLIKVLHNATARGTTGYTLAAMVQALWSKAGFR